MERLKPKSTTLLDRHISYFSNLFPVLFDPLVVFTSCMLHLEVSRQKKQNTNPHPDGNIFLDLSGLGNLRDGDFLELSKAFVAVDQQWLIHKLYSIGFSNHSVKKAVDRLLLLEILILLLSLYPLLVFCKGTSSDLCCFSFTSLIYHQAYMNVI